MSTDDALRFAVYRHLRSTNVLRELERPQSASPNIGKICCSDERSSGHETQQTQEVSGLPVLPYGIFGGAMRFSPYCPEIPDSLLGFKSSPNAIHVQVHVEKIRKGIRFRGNQLLKVSGHGLQCGLASGLGLGVWQHVMLCIDGRNYLRERSRRENWLPNGDFQIFAAYHVYRPNEPEGHQHRTYLIDKDHELVLKYSMDEVMQMSDHAFLAKEQPVVLDQILNLQR